jgi:hypothetical protein
MCSLLLALSMQVSFIDGGTRDRELEKQILTTHN